MEPDPELLAAISDRLHPTVRSLADATILLCQPTTARRPPNSVGSGVLVMLGASPYLFTASHVFDNAEPDKRLYAIIGGRFVALSGLRFRTRPGHSGIDRVDLAIIRLAPVPQERLRSIPTVELNDIDPFPNDSDSLPTTGYLAIGYPHTKQPRYLADRSYFAYAHHFLTHYEPLPEQNSIGANPHLHIAVGFNAAEFSGADGSGLLPKPTGMSGGGLWRIPDALSTSTPRPALVGILIEHHHAPHNIVLASRLANPLTALAERDGNARKAIGSVFPSLAGGRGA